MITLEKDGKTMVVSSELQATVFLRYGYKKAAPKVEPKPEEDVKIAEPKRRRRKKTE